MRLFTAISWFFKILTQGEAALQQAAPTTAPADATATSDQPAPEAQPPRDKPLFHTSTEPAVQLLGLLQREGRLIDFLQEEITGYQDAEIGAAVRDIHRGCRKVLHTHFKLRRVLSDAEGSTVTVPEGYDPSSIELQGNVTGKGPFRGTLAHPGWYVEEVKLPTVAPGADARVAAPAQVEVR